MLYNRGMKLNLIVKALLIGILGLAGSGLAQTVKKVPAKPTVAIAGKDLFKQYCAACHGVDGKGTGPAASALKAAPSDLTQIARRNHGSFPEERVMRMLQGQEAVAAHGSQEMPVWGAVFANTTSQLDMAQTRMHSLLQYLEDMQAK